MTTLTSCVCWPTAPLTESLVLRALNLLSDSSHALKFHLDGQNPQLFWSSYDEIDHEIVHVSRDTILSSSYTIRKALIRKHFLSRCLHSHLTKHPDAPLQFPKTWNLEISWADELDELWSDELWDLNAAMEADPAKWWILKPGMSDRGIGIRLFNSKEDLQAIFEEFDGQDSSDDGENSNDESGPEIITSQLRHFVIQEYLSRPLLLDPSQAISTDPRPQTESGKKFHLRVYCVSSGALTCYVYLEILALFSSVAYTDPVVEEAIDLKPHLTNTSLQTHLGEQGVRLLDELVGCEIMSDTPGEKPRTLTDKDIVAIIDMISDSIAETFKAALDNPIHFQPQENAFELWGVDFVVTHAPSSPVFQVNLLEVNAEPAIELTGPRLVWILEDLFEAIGKVCVAPFFAKTAEKSSWKVGETQFGLRKCLEMAVRPKDHRP